MTLAFDGSTSMSRDAMRLLTILTFATLSGAPLSAGWHLTDPFQVPEASAGVISHLERGDRQQKMAALMAIQQSADLRGNGRVRAALLTALCFGSQALDAVLAALDDPAPAGYSENFKARLIDALTTIADVSLRRPASFDERLVLLARQRLRNPESSAELVAVVRLTDCLDDDESLKLVGAMAASAEPIRAAGVIEPEQVAAVQAQARAVLKRRVSAP